MTAVGSWPGIERHGLRSTTALLDLFEVAGSDRERIESQHRPESETIHHPRYGTAVIRDQKPMSDGGWCARFKMASSRVIGTGF